MKEQYNPFSLQNKNILVTGASSGIGQAIAIECSRLGANVIATGRNENRLKETIFSMDKGGHKYVIADISKEEEIDKVVKECSELDGVVHAAGIGDRTLLSMVKKNNIAKIMSVNFEAPVLLQKALIKKKKMSNEASIIFIASRAAQVPTVGNGLYAASKAALISYAKVLAIELADRKIRVNCIAPAMVWTELVKRDQEILGIDYHEKEKEYPLKRYGQPVDIAYLAVYMLSNASSWMTGSCVDITGGENSL